MRKGVAGSGGRGSAACPALNLGLGSSLVETLRREYHIGRWVLNVMSVNYFLPVTGNILKPKPSKVRILNNLSEHKL